MVALIAAAFLLGCVAVHLMPALPALAPTLAAWLHPVLAAATVVALLRVPPRWWARALTALAAAMLLTVIVAGGRLASRLPAAQHASALRVEARVDGVVTAFPGGCRFALVTRAVNDRPRRLRLRTSWFGTHCERLVPGAWWELVVRVYVPRGLVNPGTFDYEGWLFREGFDGTAWVDGRHPQVRLEAPPSARGWLDRRRLALARALRAALPDDVAPAAPLIEALTLGLRGAMDASLRDTLAATGTSHLFAISGLHVGLLAGAVLLVARVLLVPLRRLRWPGRLPVRALRAGGGSRLAVVAALVAAFLYAALAGFSIPTRRALLAVVVAGGAVLARRDGAFPDVLGAALLLVLLFDPLAPLSPGFWLSFGAVATLGMAAAGLPREARGPTLTRLRAGAGTALRLQIAVTLGLLPLGLLVFEQFSLWAPVVNLVMIPAFSFLIVPAALLGVLTTPFAEGFGALMLRLDAQALLQAIGLLEWFAGLPPGAVTLHRPVWVLGFAQAGALLLASPLPGRVYGAIACLPLLCWRPVPLPAGTAEVVLLDVGQGASAVVRTRRHTLLFDAGPSFRSGGSAGALAVLPFLAHEQVRRLDRIVVSHGDDDHRGGIDHVLAEFPGTASSIGGASTEFAPCREGVSWEWDGVGFRFLHPPGPDWRGNDGSCVLQVTVGSGAGRRAALLTGDIEARAEHRLVARYGDTLQAALVVVPHHGSRTSSTPAFVAATAPALALIPRGYGNRWNFPAPEVVSRWRRVGAGVRDTALDGALTVKLTADRRPVRVNAERDRRRRYWMSK